ncbi:hypothetical protein [Chryseobacterium vaccae]|uniref:hypothetical protein n=1 Tax=Chryseobacterium vaccae TaxID=2604424 RepID=UPI0012966C77|nr:hypothetical protein [Chryseobacterium vaccae]
MNFLKENKNKHFLLYSHNFIIKGEDFDLIFDNNRDLVFQIPKGINQIISLMRVNTIAEIYTKCKAEFEQIVLFIERLQELNLGFITDAVTHFPKLKLRKDAPYREYSKLITISPDHADFYNSIQAVNTNNTKYIELRIEKYFDDEILGTRTIQELNRSSLYGVNIVLDFERLKTSRKTFMTFSERIEKRCSFFIEHEGKEGIKKYKNVHFYFMNKKDTDTDVLITNKKFFEKRIFEIKNRKNGSPYIFFKPEFAEP